MMTAGEICNREVLAAERGIFADQLKDIGRPVSNEQHLERARRA